MEIYRKMGVSSIINAAGTLTRLGGTIMLPEVQKAMAEASLGIAPIDQLQAAASDTISRACGSQAGYVVSGASAGLTMAAAACMAGLDVAKMDRLPFPEKSPDEIIICRPHRNSYDHAFRTSGAKLIEVGLSDRYSGAGVRDTEAWEIEAAITDRTAAIAYTAGPNADPPLTDVAAVGKKHKVPVIVDAAAQLPPPSNLRRFISEGADLVCFSGGKALKGPQGTGILAGRSDLIASVALQHMDMDVTFELWDPPHSLIPKEKIKGVPRHGIGRGFKVSKEQIIGVVVALECFTEERCRSDRQYRVKLTTQMEDDLRDCPCLTVTRLMPENDFDFPLLKIQVDENALGHTAYEVVALLKKGDHPVYVRENDVKRGTLWIHPLNLDEASARQAAKRLAEVVRSL